MTFIPVILGTAREGRQSEKVARFVMAELQKVDDVETKLIDPRDFLVHGAMTRRRDMDSWKDVVTKTDGFVIVIPEYNHGYPGELKILLDAAFDEYKGKTVALCGVSSGRLGGARAVENIKPVLNALHLHVTTGAVYFSNVKTLFDEKDEITDTTYTERLTKLFDELLGHINNS